VHNQIHKAHLKEKHNLQFRLKTHLLPHQTNLKEISREVQLHKIRQLLQHQVHPLQLLQINLILFQRIHPIHPLQLLQINLILFQRIHQYLQHPINPLQLLQISLILFQQIHLSHLQQLQLNLKLVKRHFYICRLFQLTLFLLQSNNLQFKVLYIKAVIQVTDLDTP
jgi:hypothetical protein